MLKRKPKDPERSPDLPHNWIERQLQRVQSFVVYDAIDIDDWDYRNVRLTEAYTYKDLDEGWSKISLGDQWGGYDTTGLFRRRFVIPEGYTGENAHLDIFLDGGEAQLSIDGRPWQGLDWNRSMIPLAEYAEAGREIELDIEAFIINYPYDDRRNDEREFHTFKRARLVKIDKLLESFMFDAWFVYDAYMSYWKDDDNLEIESFLLHHLDTAVRMIPLELSSRSEVHQAAAAAGAYLKKHVYESGRFSRDGRINALAHSHLDIVYLWPIKETYRKNTRTCTNQLSLMREYPEYCYSNSQPYLYEHLRDHYPSVFGEIKDRITEGRWEPIGAMYLEPDGNLLGPESLVRQLLFGKRFLKKEFGVDARTCWLPDVFGVMYTLPQVLKKAGVEFFLTNKLSIWNDVNDFPHDTFKWRGPDGSEVITHFPPIHFGQKFEMKHLKMHWERFREKNETGESLHIYGFADGGGGPTREMFEYSKRAENFPGLPEVKIDTAEAFFDRVKEKADTLEVWDDELYLEAHRGTSTSDGELKRLNRKGEVLFRDAEIINVMASLFGDASAQQELGEGWKYLMLNQFHDTLTGSHSDKSCQDILDDYTRAFEIGEAVLERSMKTVADHAGNGEVIVLNTLGWERSELVCIDADLSVVTTADGRTAAVQQYDGKSWFRVDNIPSMGWVNLGADGDCDATAVTVEKEGDLIRTPFYELSFADDGSIASLVDREAGREVLAGNGNKLQVFEDNPGYKFSAWDVSYHLERFEHEVVQQGRWELVSNGPHFAVFSSTFTMKDSLIEQEIWLYAEDRRIDFKTTAEWKNSQKMLKVAFPVDIRTKTATYDLPFGHIERTTHRNTGWDKAKFEVNGHKWADLSEGDYGVALLNDCKYGYDIKDNQMRLSLIRSPIRPNPTSDIGHHEFTYSLLPHAGNWRDASVDRAGYELNIPVYAATVEKINTDALNSYSMIDVASESIIVEAVKHAEDSDDVILRTFDSHGTRRDVSVSCDITVGTVHETDLLEQEERELKVTGNSFSDRYTPYEIKTHKIQVKR